MNYKNGYKVVYEIAADGKRTFYAAKSDIYPTRDEDGKIIDTELATFNDADFAGKTIYEYKGEFYVSDGALPAYDKDGIPKDTTKLNFKDLLVEAPDNATTTTTVETEVKDEEPDVNTNEPSNEGAEPGDNGKPEDEEQFIIKLLSL